VQDRSFAGPSATATTVADVMTAQVIALRPKDPLARAYARALDEKISAVPVLDEDGRPVGILSKSDLLLTSIRDQDTTAEEVMSSPVATIRQSAPLSLAAATMAKEGFHRLVVVDGSGIAVGILSSLDVLRWLANEAGFVIAD